MQNRNSGPRTLEPSIPTAFPFAARPVIAVLPLVEQDDECLQGRLGSWLADDLIHHLSRFRQFAVMARQSSFFAGPDSARVLRADFLVRGSVRMVGAACELEVMLVQAAGDEVVWRKVYRQAPIEPVEIEDELAQAIATELAVEIGSIDPMHPAPQPFRRLAEAAALVQRIERDAKDRARQIATGLRDDEFHAARAHAILARSHHLDWRYRWSDDPENARKLAAAHAELAVQIDPMDATAQAEMAIDLLFRREHDAAISTYRRALELNPNDCSILAEFGGCLAHSGDPASAVELLQLALSLDPRRADHYRWLLSGAVDDMGDPETAVCIIEQMSAPREAARQLASCLGRLGQKQAAAAAAERVLARHPRFTIDHWRTIVPTRDPAVREPFFEGLALAGLR